MKKQTAAEFAMAADGIIRSENFNYNKNDVFAEIERNDFLKRLNYHLIVWNDKSLLNFLETNTVNIKKIKWAKLSDDKDFVAFLSPYFSEPYSNVMKKYLQKYDWQNAVKWLLCADFILPDDEETAYKSLRNFVNDSLRMFRNLNSTNYFSKKKELNYWGKKGCADFFNNLSDSLYLLSQDTAQWLIHVTVELQKKERWLAFCISLQLTKFKNVSPSYRNLISKNHKIYSSNMRRRLLRIAIIFLALSKMASLFLR